MLFYQALIACLFGLLIKSDSATIKIPSCDGLEDGIHPVEGFCRRYTTCQAGVGTTDECSIIGPFVFMWSTENKQCVPTTFTSCESMQENCPTLPALKWRADRLNGKEFMETFGSLETETQEELTKDGFTQDNEFKCPEETGVFGVAADNSSYRICVAGKAFGGKCDENEVFSVESKTCVDKLGTVDNICEGPPNGDTDCSDAYDGFYGIKNNCRFYQVCCGKTSDVKKCPLGLRFDIEINSCILLTSATCQS